MMSDAISLRAMIGLSMGIGGVAAIAGYWLAHWLDASIAGSMASMVGALFLAGLLLAPDRGLVAVARRRARQRLAFAQTMLTIHLLNHEGLPEAIEESRVDHLNRHLSWDPAFIQRIVQLAERDGLVQERRGLLTLTEDGRERARTAMAGT